MTGFAELPRPAGAASSATRRAATPRRRSSATSATRGPRATARRCARCGWPRSSAGPIIVFVDTPAAYPGIESEERGVAEAIAVNLREMMLLDTPIIVIVQRRGRQRRRARHRGRRSHPDAGVRDLQRHSAGRLRGDPVARSRRRRSRRPRRSSSPRPTCCKAGIIDEIVPEPVGGAHTDPTRPRRARRRGARARARRGRARSTARRGSTRATRSSATWAGWASISWTRAG